MFVSQQEKAGSRNPLWRHSSAKLPPPDEQINAAAVLNPKHLHRNICIVEKVFALTLTAVIYRYQYSCLSETQ